MINALLGMLWVPVILSYTSGFKSAKEALLWGAFDCTAGGLKSDFTFGKV